MFKKSLLIVVMLIAILTLCLVACDSPSISTNSKNTTDKEISSITVEGALQVNIEEFNLSNYKLRVDYKDGTSEKINMSMDYLDATELGKIYDSGAHTLTVNYKNVSTNWVIKIVGSINKYNVEWKNYDGTILKVESFLEGSTPAYTGTTPTKQKSGNYIYEFDGWDPVISEVKEDVTYTAKYKEVFNAYTVVFKDYDGTELSREDNVSAKRLNTITADTEEPKRSADAKFTYAFDSWIETQSDDVTTKIFTASYIETIRKYFISFRSEDNSLLQISEVEYGVLPKYEGDTPEKSKSGITYYTFSGWDKTLSIATCDVDYIATFTSETRIEVIYNMDGGTSATTLENKVIIDRDVTVDDFSFEVAKDACKFRGWKYNGQKIYDENGKKIREFKMAATMTFTPVFVLGAYLTLINNIPDSGELTGEDDYTYGTVAKASATPNAGYEFVGWYDDTDGLLTSSNQYSFVISKDTTITAKFNPLSYSLTLNSLHEEYGSVKINDLTLGASCTGSIPYTSSATLTAVNLDSVVFRGWFIDDELISSDAYYTFTMPHEDVVIEAKWCKFNVTYVLNGGTNSLDNPSFYLTGKGDVVLKNPTKDYYDFAGWKLDGNIVTSISNDLKGDITLEATWTPTIYTLTYDYNGASSSDNNPIGYTVESDDIKLNNPIKESYNFIGWKLEGETTTSLEVVITKGSHGNRKYIAVFDSIPLAVSYVLNSGTNNVDNPLVVKSEKLPIELKAASKEGYKFVGWNLSADGKGTFITTLTEYKSYTLYAVFVEGTDGIVFTEVSGGYAVSAYTGSSYKIIVPEEYNGKPVIQINAKVFKEESNGTHVIETVWIPSSVKTIDNYAFQCCYKLLSITFNEGLEYIGQGAFEGCVAITNVSLPSTVTFIGIQAFNQCWRLEGINIPNGVTNIGNSFIAGTKVAAISLPDSITEIPESLFASATNLQTVTMSDNVTKIGKGAFYMCTSLTSITFPSSLTTIGQDAFNNSGLKQVIIPETVTSLGQGAFYYCRSLEYAEINHEITEIGTKVFGDCDKLTKIKLYKTYVENLFTIHTCYSCDNLKTLVLGKGYIDIVEHYVDPYKSSVLPTNGDKGVGQNLPSLKEIEIGDTVTKIDWYAFANCWWVEKIVVPDTVTFIGEYAFVSCSNLKEIVLGHGAKWLNNYTFRWCEKLETVVIPEGFTTMDAFLFEYSGVKNIYIPKSMNYINLSAFKVREHSGGRYEDKPNTTIQTITFEDTYGWLFNEAVVADVADPAANVKLINWGGILSK